MPSPLPAPILADPEVVVSQPEARALSVTFEPATSSAGTAQSDLEYSIWWVENSVWKRDGIGTQHVHALATASC